MKGKISNHVMIIKLFSIQSQKIIQGFWKKVSLLIELLVGILLKIQLKLIPFSRNPA